MKRLMIILFLLVFVMASCNNTTHCIKIEGEKNGFSGEFEYCINKGESEKNSAPVLSNSDGENVFLIEESWIEAALGGVGVRAGETKTPYQRFVEYFGKVK